MSQLTQTLAQYGAQILDIGQAVIHEDLALGILVSIDDGQAGSMIKDIMFRGNEAGSTIRVSHVNDDNYQLWLEASGQTRYILTLLTVEQASAPLHAVSGLTHRFGLNIDTIRRLTDRVTTSVTSTDPRMCVEMRVRGTAPDTAALRAELMLAADEQNFDFSLQEDTVFRRNRRLVAFDMDSTLITEEVIDELAKRHGVGEAVAAITADAMAGRIDFKESFRRRSGLLSGMPTSQLQAVAESVQLNKGAQRLVQALKHFGYKTAIISGGFQYVGEYLQAQLGVDYVFANTLVEQDGIMTGEVAGDIVDAQRKAAILRELAQAEGVALEQTIAIGDGANDLPMLDAAGLGVAFHAKPIVRESAGHAISNFGLDAILYLIGFSDRDIDQALSSQS